MYIDIYIIDISYIFRSTRARNTRRDIHVWLFMSRDLENQTIVVYPTDLVIAMSITNRQFKPTQTKLQYFLFL